MIIYTENLKPFRSLFNAVKVNGNAYYDHVFLDFRTNTASFFNESASVKINLMVEGERDQDYMYVDGTKFFFLVQNFSQLRLEDGRFFSEKGDKFVIPKLDEDLSIEIKEDYSGVSVGIPFTKELSTFLSVSKDFLDKEAGFPYLFFENGKMILISQARFISVDSHLDKGVKFSLPQSVIKILQTLSVDEGDTLEFRIRKAANDGDLLEFNYKDLLYKFASSSEALLPTDVFGEEFAQSYDHEEYFTLDFTKFNEAAKMLNTFLESSVNPCKFEFVTAESKLKISLLNESEVEYYVDLKEVSNLEYFEDKFFWVSISNLVFSLNPFGRNDKDITICFREGAPAVKMTVENPENLFTVQTLVEEPNL